jgi:hypothetical protein
MCRVAIPGKQPGQQALPQLGGHILGAVLAQGQEKNRGAVMT